MPDIYTMNVDYFDLKHNECMNDDFEVDIDSAGYIRFDGLLPEGALVDDIAFYRNGEYMFCVENPYSNTAILKYTYVAMLRTATKEEIDYMRDQIRHYHREDAPVDKAFVVKMIDKYVSFDF